MWIGNKWVDAASSKTYKVVNPATEEEIAQVPLASSRPSIERSQGNSDQKAYRTSRYRQCRGFPLLGCRQ